jgi:hypothetical protein
MLLPQLFKSLRQVCQISSCRSRCAVRNKHNAFTTHCLVSFSAAAMIHTAAGTAVAAHDKVPELHII